MTGTPPVDPRFDARFQRGWDGQGPDDPATRPAERIEVPRFGAAPTRAPVEPAGDSLPDVPNEPVGPNPWLRRLTLASTGAIVVGLAGIVRNSVVLFAPTGPPDVVTQMLNSLGWAVPGPLLTAGIIGLALRAAVRR